jgi:hypothetical protein
MDQLDIMDILEKLEILDLMAQREKPAQQDRKVFKVIWDLLDVLVLSV